MRKLTTALAAAAAAVLVTLAATSMTSRAAGSYADDRSEIEDLQARYLFALDFRDPELYVTTFTEDGILDVGSGDQRAVQEQMLALHATRTSLLRVQSERLIQRVNLNLALGGGFEAPPQ